MSSARAVAYGGGVSRPPAPSRSPPRSVAALAIAGRNGPHVRVETSNHLSAADVSFAIFDRPARGSDALPEPWNHGMFTVDPKIGSRLALRSGADRVFVYAVLPSCPGEGGSSAPAPDGSCPAGRRALGEQYCVVLVRDTGSGGSCASPAGIAVVGAEVGTNTATGADSVVFGLVPDFVSRVTYDGRVVPIVGNAFVIRGATRDKSVVVSTPDGDKTPLPACSHPLPCVVHVPVSVAG